MLDMSKPVKSPTSSPNVEAVFNQVKSAPTTEIIEEVDSIQIYDHMFSQKRTKQNRNKKNV